MAVGLAVYTLLRLGLRAAAVFDGRALFQMTIFLPLPLRIISSAVKMPAGPAPTMTTSVLIVFNTPSMMLLPAGRTRGSRCGFPYLLTQTEPPACRRPTAHMLDYGSWAPSKPMSYYNIDFIFRQEIGEKNFAQSQSHSQTAPSLSRVFPSATTVAPVMLLRS